MLALDWVVGVIGLSVFATWITMLSSRCCAPCCCGPQMPDVDPPCPPGECSCSNLHLLDYPFYIAVSGDIAGTFVISLIEAATLQSMPGLRAVVFVWAILVAVGAVTGFRKFRLLSEKSAMRSAQSVAGGTSTPTPGVTVVGTPVVGSPVRTPVTVGAKVVS
eukprot:Skav234403  [mRNA]  locus=scaffold873:298205:298690:- [translate_table: standard]